MSVRKSDAAVAPTRGQLRRRLMLSLLVTCCAVVTSGVVGLESQGRNPALAAGVALVLMTPAGLVAALFSQRSRRRHAEEQLRRGQAELRASYDRIHDIGGRLLTAQEGERARIARELHDDIAQQLALLRLDLNHSANPEALCRLDEIARSVHALSHRLHPAKVQILGLVPSLRSLASEHSRCDLSVSFTHGNIPSGLPVALTLCLFRVVQEALQNAVKHSEATLVSVDLQCNDAQLILRIADDGVGFVPETAWGKGLGLISVRERVEGAGGTVKIRSSPGCGARFEANVPVPVRAAIAC